MKAIFSVLSAILLSLIGLCLEASANLTLQQMQNRMNGATLISGLNIQTSDMFALKNAKNEYIKNAFRNRGKNRFILIPQFESTCGTTSAEMLLHYYGKDVTQGQIWGKGNIHVIEFGSFPQEIELALDRLGVPSAWLHESLDGVSLEALRSWVREDRPPIVLLRFGEYLHYVVVVGYNNQGDFLLADPNYLFRWMSSADFQRGWSLKPPGLPNDSFEVTDGFKRFGLNTLAFGVNVLTGGNNVIVPHHAPSTHFSPNHNAVTVLDGDGGWDGGRAVRGGNRFNPLWTTDPWEETFTFTEDIVDYRLSAAVPVEFENLGGLEPAYIQGHKKVDNRTVKVWGRITPGKVTKGRIFLFIRGYKDYLTAHRTHSNTQYRHYKSSWSLRLGWDSDLRTFTFPGEVVSYTISAEVPFVDRLGAELTHHYKDGNTVKFRTRLRKHKVEPNEITVYVTAHYEPPSVGSFQMSHSGSLSNIPSGESRRITVKVSTRKGHPMRGVPVRFLESNESEIGFYPKSATTNNSGVATTKMITGSHGSANFTIAVDGLSSKTYNVTVAKVLKEYTEKSWFSSEPTKCKLRAFGKCIRWKSRSWYTSSHHIDVPSWIPMHDYSISTHVPLDDLVDEKFRNTKPYVKSSWRSGNRVHLEIRFKTHANNSNDILVRVHAKYWGTARPPTAPLHPEVRPDPDPITAAWQDLSYIPPQTALLPNYPNPFNPETWIPYHLSEAADVTLTIYSTDGRLVRRLALGHQPAGIYENKSRAAYWDGRNAIGERVASGLYFYRLTAGDFAATGKMLIMK